MSAAFCSVRGLVLGYSGVSITPQPLDFDFPSGKIVALIGPNGSGKSTLLRALIGEPCLTAGRVKLSGKFAVLPQEAVFPSETSVVDSLRLAFLAGAGLFAALPARNDKRIQDALCRFDLSALSSRALGSISTGERQRVFLARALLQEPSVLLLDEPTNHLDPGGVDRFWRAFLSMTTIDGSRPNVVLSTHDLSFAKENCDWVLALKQGTIAFQGTKQDFFSGNRIAEIFSIYPGK